ncbi:MAG TPA: hypothetical protein DCE56_10780 [Cyanobacteria bacterium UBA8553]|nr:hypothetical protein [Cyanobacteria bacterium UBA8553]HAJ63623.1 hypothetical protein [Cyanobacteria bacterium UBA8543]
MLGRSDNFLFMPFSAIQNSKGDAPQQTELLAVKHATPLIMRSLGMSDLMLRSSKLGRLSSEP